MKTLTYSRVGKCPRQHDTNDCFIFDKIWKSCTMIRHRTIQNGTRKKKSEILIKIHEVIFKHINSRRILSEKSIATKEIPFASRDRNERFSVICGRIFCFALARTPSLRYATESKCIEFCSGYI